MGLRGDFWWWPIVPLGLASVLVIAYLVRYAGKDNDDERQIREAVEARGYRVKELAWEPPWWLVVEPGAALFQGSTETVLEEVRYLPRSEREPSSQR